MLIEATSQTVAGMVYVLTGNDDLNVGSGVTLISLSSDAILANSGQHQITVSGVVNQQVVRSGEYVMRVPLARLNQALQRASRLGRVTNVVVS